MAKMKKIREINNVKNEEALSRLEKGGSCTDAGSPRKRRKLVRACDLRTRNFYSAIGRVSGWGMEVREKKIEIFELVEVWKLQEDEGERWCSDGNK